MADTAEGKNTPPDSAFIAASLGKIIRADEKFQTAKNEHQSVEKTVEGKGINLKAAKRAIKIMKSGKTDEIVEELKALFVYLRILGYPVSDKQMEMFDFQNSRTPIEDRAYEEGLFAGRLGFGQDACGYDVTSKAGQKWLDGFGQGNSDRTQVMQMEAEAPEHIRGDDAVNLEDEGSEEWDQADPEKKAAAEADGGEKSAANDSRPPKPPAAKTGAKAKQNAAAE